jgi:pteridine reductase
MTTGNRVALVTGGARRIGAAIVRRLHADGHDIALHYRHSSGAAQTLATQLTASRPGSVLLLQADLDDVAASAGLVDSTVAHYGRLDALVNNASTFFPTTIGATSPAQWESLFAANVRAPFFLAQAAAVHLRRARGAIVNLVDIHGERPLRDHAAYGASKAALIHMTSALALDLAPDVRVNAVAPGAILWPEHGKDGKDVAAQTRLIDATPLARIGTPEEVAEAVRWLLRDATYCTGQVIRVDGGRTLAG